MATFCNCAACGREIPTQEAIAFGEAMVCVDCKDSYAQAVREGSASTGVDAMRWETMRNEHLKHEASLKSVGTLYYLGGALIIIGMISMVAMSFSAGVGATEIGVISIYGLLAAFMFWLAPGFRKLERRVVIPGSILAGIGLLGFPVGTLINGYILYLINGKKGKVVFSDEYQLAIQATPHIKYKSSPVVVIVLAILLLTILGGIGFAWLADSATPR